MQSQIKSQTSSCLTNPHHFRIIQMHGKVEQISRTDVCISMTNEVKVMRLDVLGADII